MWKNFWKSSISLGDIASWNVLMFLKIVTKWREIRKLKLNNSLTNWAFFTFYSIRSCFFKLFDCFALSWNLNSAVNLVTAFSRQKPLKWKNKKQRIFWNTKFYHPAKFELKRKKSAKVVPSGCSFWRPMGPPWLVFCRIALWDFSKDASASIICDKQLKRWC